MTTISSESTGGGGIAAARDLPTLETSITVGGLRSSKKDGETVGEIANEIRHSRPQRQTMKATTKALFEALDRKEGVTDSSQAAAGAPDAGATSSPTASPDAGEPAAATAAPAPTPDPTAEITARADRLVEHNRKLLAEVEALKRQPRHAEPTPRAKKLDEIERMYLEDPVGAVRRLAALAIGAEDHESKEVDEEQAGLYQDLTERELKVSLDENKKALREAARTRKLLARDKKERDPAPAPVAAPVDDTESKQAIGVIDDRLVALKHAEKFPLLMALSKDIDGKAPADALWTGIKHWIGTGELDGNLPNDQLIEQASKRFEDHYDRLEQHHQALADKIRKARPTNSTAAPTTAADAKATSADPSGTAVRTITNASASVAPATPPATKPLPGAEPTYRNEDERRAAILKRHFGEAPKR